MKQTFFLFMAWALVVVSCRPSAEERGEMMLHQIETAYKQGKYDEALVLINSLRKDYPKAVGARKKALRIYQDAVLKKAQDDLGRTDARLRSVASEYERARTQAEAAKQAGQATARQLSDVPRLRMLRDSLQVRFDTQVARIRFIHKKQKENKPL